MAPAVPSLANPNREVIMAAKSAYLRCKDGFVLPDRTIVKVGQVVRANSRVVKFAPDNFEPVDDSVEQATASPGERRIMPKRNPEAVVMTAAARRNLRTNALPAEHLPATVGTSARTSNAGHRGDALPAEPAAEVTEESVDG